MHRDETPRGKTLARSGERHGYEVANAIQRTSDDVLHAEKGSLYPALQRMPMKAWVKAYGGHTRWESPEVLLAMDRPGPKRLELELPRFERALGSIDRAMQMA